MKIRLFVLVVATCALRLASAAELGPVFSVDELGIALSGIHYPDTLRADLRSGLENRIVVRVALADLKSTLSEHTVVISIRYDLWEERFVLHVTKDGMPSESIALRSESEMIQYLEALHLQHIFDTDRLSDRKSLQLRCEVLVNPISRERMEKLREWVAANTAPRSAAGGAFGGSPPTSRPNDLFNKIFDQYLRGEDVSVIWRTTVLSPRFDMPKQVR